MDMKKRKRLFVDPKVQGALIGWALLYWVSYLASVKFMQMIVTSPLRILWGQVDDAWLHYVPAVLASLFFVPIAICDIMRLSHRFVGPMHRFRHDLHQLAQGEHVEPIHFREGDMWHEFAEAFNAVLARVQTAGQASTDDESNVDGELAEEPSVK
jgi:hypothetical protein